MILESSLDRNPVRGAASDGAISPQGRDFGVKSPETLQDLLDSTRRTEPEAGHLLKMLGATAAHIAIHLGLPPNNIDIRALLEIKPGLEAYFGERDFKRNSVRSYTNYLRILLRKARDLGWSPCSPDIDCAWREIAQVAAKAKGCSAIVRYAMHKGRTPADFTEADLSEWAEARIREGYVYKSVGVIVARFRKCVYDAGLTCRLPCLNPRRMDRRYGIPFSGFPADLRREAIELLAWKTAEFSPGRPYKSRHREATAHHLKELICRVFGFRVRVKGVTAHHLVDLFSEDSLRAYVAWAVNERSVSGRCIRVWLGTIRALRIHPCFRRLDFAWVERLLNELPRNFELQTKERKERKWVPYDVLSKIPDQVIRDADRGLAPDDKRTALAYRDSLLIRWLVTLPWRQRNIRECEIMSSEGGGNLFNEQIPANSLIAKPRWVNEARQLNPQQSFWQFRFRPQETKNGKAVHGVLPRQLVGPLEEYIVRYRPLLVGPNDRHTLFVNDRGAPFSGTLLGELVVNLTVRYSGRGVNPHLFRDIFAVTWLQDHPEDYLTLSKILWHSNIQTTLQIYGRGFDESHGARRVEEWLDEREAACKGKSV